MASFCPIFLPIFKDAQHSPKACAGKKVVLGVIWKKRRREWYAKAKMNMGRNARRYLF